MVATQTPASGDCAKMVECLPSVEICVVCHRLRSNGSRNQDGDIFICVQCEADADQLFEIQDAIWPPSVVAGEPTDEAAPARP